MATRKKAATKAKSPAKDKRPEGRPSSYRPEFCEIVIELGRLGKSKAQIAADPRIDVARNTLDNWCVDHPEFLSALSRARDLALSKWEDRAELGIESVGFNSGLWGRIMSARFPEDYREVKESQVTGKDGGPIKTETRTGFDFSKMTPAQVQAFAAGIGATGEGYDIDQ